MARYTGPPHIPKEVGLCWMTAPVNRNYQECGFVPCKGRTRFFRYVCVTHREYEEEAKAFCLKTSGKQQPPS